MSDRVEQALFDLGDRIVYPETPVFSIPGLTVDQRPRRGWLVAAAVATAALILMAFPGPRAAVANLFGIGSVGVTMVEELPEAVEIRPPSGEETSLEKAQLGVDFSILTIDADPDAVFLDTSVPGGLVTLGYGKADGTYRIVISQLEAETDIGAVEKLLGQDTKISVVSVGGTEGYWIEGDPHAVILFDRDGQVIEDSARLAGNTLLFVRNGVTVRIEGAFDLAQALEIAEQL